MPWQEVSIVSLRKEFVELALKPGANVQQLCRRFGISAKSGYKWLNRFKAMGAVGLQDQSRRPKHSPRRTSSGTEKAIVALRVKHPEWGARKLLERLAHLGHDQLPAPSTGQAILKRWGCIGKEATEQHKAFVRFEHAQPNSLWQMDFKGWFLLLDGQICHPLTVLDDHSRFSLGLRACGNQQGRTVQEQLRALFERYGLPRSIGVDNGPPWGDSHEHPFTPLGVWLIRHGIGVWHSRPYHPQTLGKDERFHRTLKAELLAHERFDDLQCAQQRFDAWREIYNFERPHHALGGSTPATRYRPSSRSFPATPPPIEYAPDCQIRKVDEEGRIRFQARRLRIGKAFRSYPVGIRPTTRDGAWEVYFCNQRIRTVDLTAPDSLP